MPRYAAKADRNQPEVTAALRAAGWSVYHTHTVGRGYPDLAVAKDGWSAHVEVKMPGEKLTDDEQTFHRTWQGPLVIAYSGQDAIDKCEAERARVLIKVRRLA